jgi:hypothetical protein
MKWQIFILNFLVAFGSSSDQSNNSSPGKIAIWKINSSSSSERTTTVNSQHLTRTIESSDLINSIDENVVDQKNVVILQSKDSNIFTVPHLISSIEKSVTTTFMPNVYHSPGDVGRSLHDKIMSTAQFAHTTEVKLSELLSILLSQTSSSESETKTRSFSVTVSNSDDSEVNVFDEIQRRGLSVMFIAVQEPFKVTTAPVVRGDYARLLSTSTTKPASSTIKTNVTSSSGLNLYKPAGAEYSIYYGGTYLYITPDIFTGLMTSIFIFFVLLLGYSCLGGIQTPSTFSTKIPPVGREA